MQETILILMLVGVVYLAIKIGIDLWKQNI